MNDWDFYILGFFSPFILLFIFLVLWLLGLWILELYKKSIFNLMTENKKLKRELKKVKK